MKAIKGIIHRGMRSIPGLQPFHNLLGFVWKTTQTWLGGKHCFSKKILVIFGACWYRYFWNIRLKKIYRLPSLICFSSFCLNHVSKRIALLFVYSDQLLQKGLLLLLFFVLFLLFKIIILGRCYTRWSWVSTLFSWQEEIQEEVQKVWSCKCWQILIWLLQRYNVITTKFFMLNNVTIIIK